MKPNLIFRIAVREVEAWILADIEGFSQFLGISSRHFLDDPESIIDPKRFLITLAKKSSKRAVREDIVPINANAKIGPNYNGRLTEFVLNDWSIDIAKARSNSLLRTYKSLQTYTYFPPD